jgi:hypothetical protein
MIKHFYITVGLEQRIDVFPLISEVLANRLRLEYGWLWLYKLFDVYSDALDLNATVVLVGIGRINRNKSNRT